MNRDFKGIWIPKPLWLSKELSTSEKIMLLEIDSLDDGAGCWASNTHLSEVINKSVGTAGNLLYDLGLRGWVEFIDGPKRKIKVTQKFHEIVGKEVVVVHENVVNVPRNRDVYKESNPLNNTTTIQGVATPQKKVNWDSPKSELQAFMGYYLKRCMPNLYAEADQKQVGGFFRQYGKMFSRMLATAGTAEVAGVALDEAITHYGAKGYQWGLKALSTNWGDFVNQATDKLKRG